MKAIMISVFLLVAAGSAHAGIPLTNATCPGNIEVHADEGGPIYVNGREAKLKVFNEKYYEALGGGATISLAVRPDGTAYVSYTGERGANGICEVAVYGTPNRNPGGGGDYADGDAGGPDFWAVADVTPNDRLNVHTAPSSPHKTVARLRNGTVVRNLGCWRQANSRWCRIASIEGDPVDGWVDARYLREAARPNTNSGKINHGYVGGRDGSTGEGPKLFARPTGELEVRWLSGCTALFTNEGSRIAAGSSCSNDQLRQSAEAVRASQREQ